MEFEVWAPQAQQVDLVLDGEPVPMRRTGSPREGWWTVEAEGSHGTRYAFSIDGDDPRPDPRSGWQPEGVHAASAVVDPATFSWTDGGWAGRDVRGAVFYELHVGTFTPEGTFAARPNRPGLYARAQ